MTTLEEKQKELDALQTAFDEYIVSSRELEEELDAEFTKCRESLPFYQAYYFSGWLACVANMTLIFVWALQI